MPRIQDSLPEWVADIVREPGGVEGMAVMLDALIAAGDTPEAIAYYQSLQDRLTAFNGSPVYDGTDLPPIVPMA